MVAAALQQQGSASALLSDDRNAAVQAISGQLHIDDGRGELAPEKTRRAAYAANRDGTVLMVGDGINDAPVLAAAQVSITIAAAPTSRPCQQCDITTGGKTCRRSLTECG